MKKTTSEQAEKYGMAKSVTLKIDAADIAYFAKASKKNPLSRFTILLTLFSTLAKKYFETYTGHVIINDPSANAPSDNNPSAPQPAVGNLRIHLDDEVKGKLLKDCILDTQYKLRLLLSNAERNIDDPYDPTEDAPLFYFFMNASGDFNPEGILMKIDTSNESHLQITASYSEACFDSFVIDHFITTFRHSLTTLQESIDEKAEDLEITSEADEQILLHRFNDTNTGFPNDKTINGLFSDQVAKTPSNFALVFPNGKYTYKELEEKVDGMAAHLLSTHTVQKGQIIGVLLPKTAQAVISFFAILKAGAIYLPMDPGYPAERIKYTIKDSGCSLIISDDETMALLQLDIDYITVSPDPIPSVPGEKINGATSPHDLAYLIYTSGSTGRPKGVLVENAGIVNMCLSQIDAFSIRETDRVAWFAAISFDASVSEILMALCSGAALVIPTDEGTKDIREFVDYIQFNKVTVITFPPSYLNLLSEADYKSLRCIITAGEPANVKKATEIANHGIDYFNAYGPTEYSVCATIYKLDPAKTNFNNIPIGRPIPNTEIYILDEKQRLLPVGVNGQICLSGAGVANGYLKKPELTAQLFVENPFKEGAIMYCTGDIGRWLPDGNIEFSGRKDHQVKIRGFRIELGEIETTLSQYSEDIRQVVVETSNVIREKTLIAYYVAKSELSQSKLRDYLQERLPEYMVPSFYVALERLPLTPNGKVDRNALKNIKEEDLLQKEYMEPTTPIERKLVEIWQDILGLKKVGIKDNFFELGGHSLILIKIINRINKELNQHLPARKFFSNPVISELAGYLQSNMYSGITKAPAANSYPLTPSQLRMWIVSQFQGGSLAYNMQMAVQLVGRIDSEKFVESFRILIQRHEILRTCFKSNEDGEIRQYILPDQDLVFEVQVEDLAKEKDQENKISDYILEKSYEKFDLKSAPLIHAHLLKLNEREYILFLIMHHIIGDGWSLEVLVSEFIQVYNALLQGKDIGLPALKIQYKDYAVWLKEELQKENRKIAEKFWLDQLQGEIPVFDLPGFKNRPSVQTYNGDTLEYAFPKEFSDKLKSFSKANDLTLFIVLLAGVKALLHKYSGQDDIIVGTPVAGRDHPDLEDQIGLYLNTIVLRTRFEQNYSFMELVKMEKETLLEALNYQNFPFADLVNHLNLQRDTSRSLLFDVMVMLQNEDRLEYINKNEPLTGVVIREYMYPKKFSQFDLSFRFIDKETLHLYIEYNTDVYYARLIERIFGHFATFLEDAISNPSVDINDIDYLTAAERHQLLFQFNNT